MNAVETPEARITGIAQEMLSGEVGLVEGSRQLVQLFGRLDERGDELFTPIVVLESETEDLPLGEARLRWSEEALRRKEAAVGAYLREVQAEILEVCEALVRRYSGESC